MTTKIIGIAGQSNNVAPGLGHFNELASRANDARLFQIGRAPWHSDKQVVPAEEPLDNVGHGLDHGSGMELLRYFARKPGNLAAGDTVLAVAGAAGGTSIMQWTGVEPYYHPLTKLFDLNGDFMARMDVAMQQPNPLLTFILFSLSETDIETIAMQNDANMKSGQDFVTLFQALVATWRGRYGLVPVIWVPHTPAWPVKQPQWAVAAADVNAAMYALVGVLPKFAIVNTSDLPDNSFVTGDPTTSNHYSAESFEHIANRVVYQAYPAALLA